MATESLKIVIGADISSATAAFKNLGDTLSAAGQDAATAFSGASTAVTNFGNSTKAIGRAPLQDLNAYKAAVNSLKDSLRTGVIPAVTFTKAVKDIPPAATSAAIALKRVDPAAKQAGTALTSVGRVLQDLPFGFIAIQNNLTEIPNAFRGLSQAAKESGQSIGKTLIQALTGPAGIGIALSAVTAALTFASVGFGAWERALGGAGKKQKEAKDSADELAKSIRDISSITGEATAGVQGEIAQVQALAGVISSSNRPYADRKRALEDLKEINKSYFGDLRLEDSLTGKLTAAVNEYSKALVNSAIQKAFVDEIATVAKAISDSDERIRKTRDARARAANEVAKAESQSAAVTNKINARTGELSAAGARASEAFTKAVDNERDAEKALRTERDTNTKLIEQRLQLENRLNSAISEGLKFKKLTTDGKEEDALKKRIDALKQLREEVGLTNKQQIELVQLEVQLAQRDGIKLGFTKEEIKDQVDAIIKKAFPETGGEFVASNLKIRVAGELDFSKVKIDSPDIEPIDIAGAVKAEEIPADAFDGVINSIRSGAARAQGALEDARDGIASIAASIQDAIVSAFDGLGAALGDALSGGGFSGVLAKFGETVLKIIGGVLQDIGKQIVVASKLVATLKKVLSSVGLGAASLVVGLALVALGGVLKNIKFNTPQFEKGGIASGPRSGYLATLHGTELIIPMNKIDKRPAASTGLQGGANGLVVLQPSLAIDGRSIKVMLNRIDRTDNRIF